MDIANANLTGNCNLLNLKEKSISSGAVKLILGIKILLPAFGPFTIVASMTRDKQSFTINLVPLYAPFIGSRFLTNIIGQFFFNCSTYDGIPDGCKVCKLSLSSSE